MVPNMWSWHGDDADEEDAREYCGSLEQFYRHTFSTLCSITCINLTQYHFPGRKKASFTVSLIKNIFSFAFIRGINEKSVRNSPLIKSRNEDLIGTNTLLRSTSTFPQRFVSVHSHRIAIPRFYFLLSDTRRLERLTSWMNACAHIRTQQIDFLLCMKIFGLLLIRQWVGNWAAMKYCIWH